MPALTAKLGTATKPRIGCAWISPEGDFYEVEDSGTHDKTADMITLNLQIPTTNPCQMLSGLGWIRLYDHGDFWCGFAMGKGIQHVTQAQLNILFDLTRIVVNPEDQAAVSFQQVLTRWIVWYCTKDVKTENAASV